jgi:hypothetical protein
MNVGTYLLFTVPLVGGSLFLYDNMRAAPRQVVDEGIELQAPAPREPARNEGAPVLQGDPTIQIERLVRENVERMLRERTGAAAARPEATTSTEVVSGSIPLPEMPSIDVPDGGAFDAPAGKFDEKTVSVLRAYMDEIERRQREERNIQMLNGQLDRLGVALTDSQRKSVIDATLASQRQVRAALQALPPGPDNREARNQVVIAGRAQYTKVISDLVPSVEADKIINALGQGWRGPGGVQGGNGVGPAGGGGGNGRRRDGD